jgi:hypothetical protein
MSPQEHTGKIHRTDLRPEQTIEHNRCSRSVITWSPRRKYRERINAPRPAAASNQAAGGICFLKAGGLEVQRISEVETSAWRENCTAITAAGTTNAIDPGAP